MTAFISLIVLAFAVSLDSFGTGLAYGIRGLELPFVSLLCISVCSAGSVLVGGATAAILSEYVPTLITEMIGGIILIGIGFWTLIHAFSESKPDTKKIVEEQQGITAQLLAILKRPDRADLDQSGTISKKEAFVLGTALSLDALGAGIGAALLGLPTLSLAVAVSLMCGIFLAGGMRSGKKLSQFTIVQKLSFLPGVLLILMGVWNLN